MGYMHTLYVHPIYTRFPQIPCIHIFSAFKSWICCISESGHWIYFTFVYQCRIDHITSRRSLHYMKVSSHLISWIQMSCMMYLCRESQGEPLNLDLTTLALLCTQDWWSILSCSSDWAKKKYSVQTTTLVCLHLSRLLSGDTNVTITAHW